MSDRNRRTGPGRQPARPSRGKNPAAGSPNAAGGSPKPEGASPKTGGAGSSAVPGTGPGASAGAAGARRSSHSPSGTTRAGRRALERKRPPQPATPTLIDTLRKPFLVSFLVFVLMAVGLVIVQAASPAYSCQAVDTVQSPAPSELGQVQPDQGNQHVQPGDKIVYQQCPPASGKHINQVGYGPLLPKVYGPDDKSVPNGWVHNLEHGGLVLLYSCDKGACDATSIAGLQAFSGQFPASPVCNLQPGVVGPVIARFEQMPTKYAALLWDRALYLDSLDTQAIDQFFLRYGERLSSAGKLIAPPEPQCSAPSASPAASSSPAPSASGS